MADRERIKDAVDFEMFMKILGSMSKDEFEDYVCELEDLYHSVHPKLEREF